MQKTKFSIALLVNYVSVIAAISAVSVISATNVRAQDKSGDEIVIEAESTKSQTGEWKLETEIEGFKGAGYIVFTGNKPTNGPAKSPLEYPFTVKETGLYYLHIRCAKETLKMDGKMRNDVANDCYVRVAGDFAAAPDADKDDSKFARLSELKTDHKFFGGKPKEFAWASGKKLDIGGDRHKKIAAYQFKSGEKYTLTVSGRSQKFKIDQFMFSPSAKVKAEKKKAKK